MLRPSLTDLVLGYRADGRPILAIRGAAPNAVIDRLLEQRSEQEAFIDGLLDRVQTEGRDLVDAERSNLNAARERIAELDAQLEPLEAFERQRAAHRQETPRPASRPSSTPSGLSVAPREQAYSTPGHFMVDLVRAMAYPGPGVQTRPDPDAAQRVSAALGRAAGDVAPGPHQTTADTPGILPVTIVGEILNDLDAARPFVSSIGIKPLGSIPGKTFNRPRVTQHTLVGEQSAEKAELPTRELTIDSIAMTKKTYGGHLNVSRQDIDWTDPSAWNAILTDLQLEYGAVTEDAAATAFATAVTQTQAVADADDLTDWISALYLAAVKAATANGTKRATALRLPNMIWTSVDRWATLGSVISVARATYVNASGSAAPTNLTGDILDIPRVMAPGLPAGTVIVGRKEMTEFYEERIGLLQAVEPKVFGVDIAYGGYVAWGTIDPTAFVKLTVTP